MSKKTFVTKEQIQEIVKSWPTPFHLYDEKGIRENAQAVKEAFAWNPGFREYFAVKATPNPFLINILKEYGCGTDCSSMTELMLLSLFSAILCFLLFSQPRQKQPALSVQNDPQDAVAHHTGPYPPFHPKRSLQPRGFEVRKDQNAIANQRVQHPLQRQQSAGNSRIFRACSRADQPLFRKAMGKQTFELAASPAQSPAAILPL